MRFNKDSCLVYVFSIGLPLAIFAFFVVNVSYGLCMAIFVFSFVFVSWVVLGLLDSQNCQPESDDIVIGDKNKKPHKNNTVIDSLEKTRQERSKNWWI